MKPQFYSEFDHLHPKVDFSDSSSMTRQEFKDEANVNNLLKRYALTGSFYDPMVLPKATLQFGDFTTCGDYQHACDVIIRMREYFDSLPLEIRKRFNYDPSALLNFLADPENRGEAEKLGLIAKAAEAATPEPAAGVSPAGEPAKDSNESVGKDSGGKAE